MNSFQLFEKYMSEVMVQQHPDMKKGEISKALGNKWNQMSDQEKFPFNEMARQDQARAEQEYYFKKN